MERTPSNTREQCAFDSGKFKASIIWRADLPLTAEQWAEKRDQRNPHKKGSVEHQFWNDGFNSVSAS